MYSLCSEIEKLAEMRSFFYYYEFYFLSSDNGEKLKNKFWWLVFFFWLINQKDFNYICLLKIVLENLSWSNYSSKFTKKK